MKSILLILLFSSLSAFGQTYQDDCLDSLDIPAAITPNEDRINEYLFINFPCPPEKFEYAIYNRWGSLIYITEDFKFQWDGSKEDGDDVQEGTYFYVLKYTFNGGDFSKTGSLTIMR
jgi:gliding motility-associated-like protein